MSPTTNEVPVVVPWRVQLFRLTDECSNCGAPMLFGFPHMCRPVGERRIREIIREEMVTSAVVAGVPTQQMIDERELIRHLLEDANEEAVVQRRRVAASKTGGRTSVARGAKRPGRPRKSK